MTTKKFIANSLNLPKQFMKLKESLQAEEKYYLQNT